MAKCEPQQFSGVTGAQFAQLLSRGKEMGIPIEGESGQATRDGVTVAWAYDPAASSLTVQCLDAPFFVPCGVVNGRIQSAISDILANTSLG